MSNQHLTYCHKCGERKPDNHRHDSDLTPNGRAEEVNRRYGEAAKQRRNRFPADFPTRKDKKNNKRFLKGWR